MTVTVTVTVTVTEHIPNTIYIFIYNTYVQIRDSLKEVLIKINAEKCNKVIDKRRLVRYNYNIIKEHKNITHKEERRYDKSRGESKGNGRNNE